MPTIGTVPAKASLSRKRLADHTVIAVTGELDIASTPYLRERLHTALRDTGAHVVIDVSGVTFCDASGLALLLDARRRVEAAGTTLVLSAPRPQLRRLLRLTGLARALTIRPAAAQIARRPAVA